MALDDFQIRHQSTVVKGGGGLTDAAAIGHHRSGAVIAGSGLPALVRGPFPKGFVVGQHVAGIQHDSVQSFTGKLQIHIPSAGDAGALGSEGSQGIPEQKPFQVLCGFFGRCENHGNFQYRRISQGFQLLLGSLQVEGIAVMMRGYFKGFHIHLGIFRFGGQLLVDCLQIRGLRLLGCIGKVHGENTLCQIIYHFFIKCMGIQLLVACTQGDYQGLTLYFCLVLGQIRCGALQRPGGLGFHVGNGLPLLFNGGKNPFLVYHQIGGDVKLAALDGGVFNACHQSVQIQSGLYVLGCKLDGVLTHVDLHGAVIIHSACGGGNCFSGILLRHSGNIHTCHSQIRYGLLRPIILSQCYHQDYRQQNKKNGGDTDGDDGDFPGGLSIGVLGGIFAGRLIFSAGYIGICVFQLCFLRFFGSRSLLWFSHRIHTP